VGIFVVLVVVGLVGISSGGKTEDFIAAARILQDNTVSVPTFLVPATRKVYDDLHTLKIKGRTLAEIFRDAGCIDPASPSCAACLGRWSNDSSILYRNPLYASGCTHQQWFARHQVDLRILLPV